MCSVTEIGTGGGCVKILPLLKSLLTVDDRALDSGFTLSKDTAQDTNESENHEHHQEKHVDEKPFKRQDGLDRGLSTRAPIRPIPMAELLQEIGTLGALAEDTTTQLDDCIPTDLRTTKAELENTFYLPVNKDVYIREFTVGTDASWRALLVFIDGMADKNIINSHILQPLMILTHIVDDDVHRRMKVIAETLLPGNQAQLTHRWSEAVSGVLAGSTVVFVDGCDAALIVETKGWEHRSVGLAQTEVVVRGPHDAFTESFRANTGLVRAQFRSEKLITEMMSVGKLAKTDIALMYVKDVTNHDLVNEVKRRIEQVDVDYLADSGVLEQFLEDNPYTLVPQLMSTERPDRVAHALLEGQVAIFVGHSPFALLVPAVLWSMVHTPEDAYLRFPFGACLRALRWVSLCVAVLLPAFYVAVTNYHPEMIPTDLMLMIAGSREQVPFPAVVEVLLMEFSIELIREAGIRIPSVIGPTIGIVGALIIGQAAVQAGIVSPLLVIVVALTALASFTVPNYNLSMAVRVLRFVFLIAAAMFGFFGMALLIATLIAKLAVQKSFGVPLLAPVAPSMDAGPDVLLRGPVFAMNQRPTHLQPQKSWTQQPTTRPWSQITKPFRRRRKGK
jgi:spore germination protein KA